MKLYVARPVLNGKEIIEWFRKQGVEDVFEGDDLHVTQAFSRAEVDVEKIHFDNNDKYLNYSSKRSIKALGRGEYLVMKVPNPLMNMRFEYFAEQGCSYDFPIYKPHISISGNYKGNPPIESLLPFPGEIHLGPEKWSPLRDLTDENILAHSYDGILNTISIISEGPVNIDIFPEEELEETEVNIFNGENRGDAFFDPVTGHLEINIKKQEQEDGLPMMVRIHVPEGQLDHVKAHLKIKEGTVSIFAPLQSLEADLEDCHLGIVHAKEIKGSIKKESSIWEMRSYGDVNDSHMKLTIEDNGKIHMPRVKIKGAIDITHSAGSIHSHDATEIHLTGHCKNVTMEIANTDGNKVTRGIL